MTKRLAVAVVSLGVAVAASAGDASWQTVDTAEFTVKLPAGAARNEQKVDTAAGPMQVIMWQFEKADGMVAFTYTDYPPALVEKALPQGILDGARDGAMANVNGTLTRDEQVFLDSGQPKRKWPGRIIEGKTPAGAALRVHLFLVANRLYQVLAAHEVGKPVPGELATMVASFKLKPPPAKKK